MKMAWVVERFLKDSGRGRAVISENSEYLKNYKIPHIFITLSRNRAAWHAKWCSIILLNFELLEISEVKVAAFLDITPQTVTLCLRELCILLSWKSAHKKHRDHLHGIGYSFPQKFNMRPCKDDLFGKNTKLISYFSKIWENFPMSSTFGVILWLKY